MSDPAPSPQDYLDAADKALATWAPSDFHRLAADYIASPWFRAAVDSAFAAGVRAGRRMAATEIVAKDDAMGDYGLNVAYWHAKTISEE